MQHNFLAENHVNVIYASTEKKQLLTFQDIMDQISGKRIQNALSHILGNTQLSKNEIAYMLPFTK